MIFLVAVAFVLDWHSTIIQQAQYEENPFMRMIWQNTGDIGFTLASLFFMIVFMALVLFLRTRHKGLEWVVLPLLVFKVLIALTNYDLVPYSLTAWFQF